MMLLWHPTQLADWLTSDQLGGTIDATATVDFDCPPELIGRLPFPDGVVVLEHVTGRIDDVAVAPDAAGRLAHERLCLLSVRRVVAGRRHDHRLPGRRRARVEADHGA